MARSHTIIALACALSLPPALGGCVGAFVVGGLAAAAGGGYVAGQERGVDGVASDFAVKTDIMKALTEHDPNIQAGVTTTVYNGRVLLTGRVATPAMKMAAAQIAGRNQEVRAVYNEIEVADDSFWDEAKDTWISTQVRSEMTVDPDIRGVNYTIETENGSVYLIGSARSRRELEQVTEIARHVPGVKRVVSYVELRSGRPVAAGGAPADLGPAGPGPGEPQPLLPGADRPNGPSRTPIAVEKL